MGRIRVVTDSASDLPAEICSAQHIVPIPLDVRLGEAVDELRGISPEAFWQRAASSDAIAETAAPSPGVFYEAFRQAQADGCEGVCCITISSSLSATYQAACTGANEVTDGFPVRVVDSRLATMGEGLVVLEAAEAADAGADLDAVCAAASDAIARTSVLGTLDTLEYLRRGGRIGSAQAFLGTLLSIKPVIEVRDGVVEGESRQRTRARSLRYLADKVEAAGPLRRIAIVHAMASDVGAFEEMIQSLPTEHPAIVTFIGPVIGAHTGPGTIGVCFERTQSDKP